MLIAALVATPLQILGDPGAVQAQDETIAVSFRDMVYYVHEDDNDGVNVVVEVAEATDTGTTTLYLKAVQTDHAARITSLGDSVQITQGETSGNFVVSPENTTDADGDYPLDLMFDTEHASWPDGYAPANPLAMARVVVIDDESPNIQLGAFSQSVFEGTSTVTADGNTPATWTVQLTEEPGAGVEVTVTIASSDPDAATVDKTSIKFAATSNNVDVFAWESEQTVRVTGVEDAGFTDHSVTFTHSVSGGGYDNVATRAVTVSVTDDDTAALVVSPNGVRMIEGTSAVYRVRLNGPPSTKMDVNLTNPDPARITLSTNRLVFTASGHDRWSRWRNLYITSHSDVDKVSDAVTINHVSDGRGGFEDVSATLAIFIEDDDKPGIRVSTTRNNDRRRRKSNMAGAAQYPTFGHRHHQPRQH